MRHVKYPLVALAVALFGVVSILWRGPGPQDYAPRDIALAEPILANPLQLAVLGTSLSSHPRYDWPAHLAEELTACLNRPVTVMPITRPGASVLWGQEQIGVLAEAAPDIVLIEFAANDADILEPPSRRAARVAHLALLTEIANLPSPPQVALMTMSPASGLRGVLRPFLAQHHADYTALAAETGVGLVDLNQRWRALPRIERGLEDGLHPDPDSAREIIVPALVAYLGCGS